MTLRRLSIKTESPKPVWGSSKAVLEDESYLPARGLSILMKIPLGFSISPQAQPKLEDTDVG